MDLPVEPVPATSDLRDFPYTPIFRARLFGSSFHARASDAEWRAGVTLWLKSWDQVPAGSLPDDDIDLCRLAELGRDLKTWKKIKAGALHGWVRHADGRLYHKIVTEGVTEALERKRAQREKTAKARLAALQKRLSEAKSVGDKERITEEIRRLSQTLSQLQSQTGAASVTDPVTDSVTESKRREGKGREEKGREENININISPSAAPTERPTESADVLQVFAHWQAEWGHPQAKLDDKRRKLIRQRLRDYPAATLCAAISGYRNSPHHCGQNDRATTYDDIGLFLRDSAHVDAGLRFAAAPPRADQSALTRRNVAAVADWVPPEMREVNRAAG